MAGTGTLRLDSRRSTTPCVPRRRAAIAASHTQMVGERFCAPTAAVPSRRSCLATRASPAASQERAPRWPAGPSGQPHPVGLRLPLPGRLCAPRLVTATHPYRPRAQESKKEHHSAADHHRNDSPLAEGLSAAISAEPATRYCISSTKTPVWPPASCRPGNAPSRHGTGGAADSAMLPPTTSPSHGLAPCPDESFVPRQDYWPTWNRALCRFPPALHLPSTTSLRR
eukprot:8780853-Pyramimonas_sp.AAC.1